MRGSEAPTGAATGTPPASERRTSVEDRRFRRYSAAVPIRVLIVDDHAVVRTGLRLLLDREEDMEVVGEAGDGDEGVRAARLEKPDVVLLDVVMPGRTGLDVCSEVVAASKGKVLMLSM
jgi:CheY-like chemotaxis protein